MQQQVLSITQINEYIRGKMDEDRLLLQLAVRGEISNYKMYPSGHHYFSLKDPTGAIRCVMFKGQALRLRFRPENGMKVLVTGRVSVFPRDGAYQLYCDTMPPEGAGDLALAFEQLKEQLYKEDPNGKKTLRDCINEGGYSKLLAGPNKKRSMTGFRELLDRAEEKGIFRPQKVAYLREKLNLPKVDGLQGTLELLETDEAKNTEDK